MDGGDCGRAVMITKAELLSKTQVSWDALNAYVATLSEVQITQLTDAAGWTVKDHLMHLAVWEDGVCALLHQQDRPARMGVPADVWGRWDFEEINEVIRQRHANASWAKVEQKRQAIHKQFVSEIDALSEADLARPVRDFQANSSSSRPIYETIIGDSYDHYDSHAGWIKAIVEKHS